MAGTPQDIALILVQSDIAATEAVKPGLPIGAAAQWNIIAVANQEVSAVGGDLTLAGAVKMEAAYRIIAGLYGATAGVTPRKMADGLAAWIAVVGAPTVPTAPLSPIATPGDSQITVTWIAPASDGQSAITGYKVTRADNGAVQSVNGATFTAAFTLLTNGTTYSFSVVATNAKGDSIPSVAVTANPAGVARRYDYGPSADAPAATWLAAAAGTTSLSTYTDTTNTSFPIEFRSGIYGLDPGAGYGIQLPCETGDWLVDMGGAEWTFNTVNQRVTDIAFVTDAGTVNVARDFDPFAAYGFATPYVKSFVIRVPAGGHGARLIMPERLAKDHGFVTAITVTSIPVGSQTISPEVPVPGGGGGAGIVPLGNSTSRNAKDFANTHWSYIDRAFYSNTTAWTAKLIEFNGGNIRDGVAGKITGGDQSLGTRFWQWVVANNLNVLYISPSTAFANYSSHAVNRQVMEAVPGAAARIVAVLAPNEIDFQFANDSQRIAEINAFCTAWAGYPLGAPAPGGWPNTSFYNLFANDTRFTFGEDHSYMGDDWSPSDAKMAQAISLQTIIVGNRPKICGEAGHGGDDSGTTTHPAGNPILTEAQQADSYLREFLERDRFGYRAWCQYELGDEAATPNDYEMRLGSYHYDLSIKQSGTARKFLRSFYNSDPAGISSCPVTLSGTSSITRYNLRQRNGAWLLAIWEQANTPSAQAVTLTFLSAHPVTSWNLRTGAQIGTTSGTLTFPVSSTGTPTMVVIS